MRVVSLLPSATEILCSLGLLDQLVGVTHECDYPEEVKQLPKVTRTLIPGDAPSARIDELVRSQLDGRRSLYELDKAVLAPLQPDLIVTQTLCDVCAVAESEVHEAARSLPGNPRVLNLEPKSLEDVLDTIRVVGSEVGVPDRAEEVVGRLRARVEAVTQRSMNLRKRPRATLLEWIDPLFSSGHWSPRLVALAGGIEGIGRAGERSRAIRWEEMLAWRPEVLVIACCGFTVDRTLEDVPLLTRLPGWSNLPCARNGRVWAVDGSAYFSRPGPRLVDSLEMLAHALHPEVHPLPTGVPAPTATLL